MSVKRKKGKQRHMCKILMMAGIPAEKEQLVKDFMQAAAGPMTRGGEKDGIGYAAITAEGEMFGERWLQVADAFKNRPSLSGEESSVLDEYLGALGEATNLTAYNTFGPAVTSPVVAWIQHARFATGGTFHNTYNKVLGNVHPFVTKGLALIHNGVISNHNDFIKTLSTCDSEVLLQSYITEGVTDTPQNIEYLAKSMAGSYACAVLGSDAAGPYMDIFKSTTTNLVAIKIVELGGLVFCTNVDIVEQVCKTMGLTIQFSLVVQPGHLVRLDAVTGKVREVYPFDDSYESGYRGQRLIKEQRALVEVPKPKEPITDATIDDALEQYYNSNYSY